jgi:hypothetical protein
MGFKIYNDRRQFREIRVGETPPAHAMGIYTQGQVDALIIAQLQNSATFYNALLYGVTNNAVETSTTLQALIEQVHALPNGGTVFLPAGIYSVTGIETYPNVAIMGEGFNLTTLRSSGVGILLSQNNPETLPVVGYPNAPVSHLFLDGNNTATIGFRIRNAAYFYPSHLKITHCTQWAMNFEGVLLCSFTNLLIWDNANGIYSNKYLTTFSNLVTFNNCTFQRNAGWAIHWNNGAGLKLNSVDMELNGTTDNLNSGCVRWENGGAEGTGLGVTVNNGWFEQNRGIGFRLDEVVQTVKHTFSNFKVIDGNPAGYMTNFIRVTAEGPYKNIVEISGDLMSTDNPPVALIGANAIAHKVTSDLPAPVSATAPGFKGEVRYVGADIFRCIATDTWVKTTMTTF